MNIAETGSRCVSANWADLQAQVLDPDALKREGFTKLLESRFDIDRILICDVGSMYFIERLCKLTHAKHCYIPNRYRSATAIETKNDIMFQVYNDVYKLPFPDSTFDLVAIQNGFDLVDGNSAFSEMVRVLKPGGWLYNSMVYDSCIPWIPFIDEDLDNKICQIMELYSMENFGRSNLRKGDSRAGRKLWNYAITFGLNIIQLGSSDWILYPRPKYSDEEKCVLNLELNFYYQSCILANNLNPIRDLSNINDWYHFRQSQIDNNELMFILNQRSLLAEKPQILI